MNPRVRILFVDDDKNVLDGLRRTLREMRTAWEMVFVRNGAEALQLMDRNPFDVVVTDMRMPQMDGAELLAAVKERHPESVRIILSGYAEKEVTLKGFRAAHQYLVKPSDADTFKRVIQRVCTCADLLDGAPLKHLLSRIESLPGIPAVCARLMTVLEQPEARTREIAEVIALDLGMTTKVLQVVNSAFFAPQSRFTDIRQAVDYLGAQTIRSLALEGGMVSPFQPEPPARFDADGLLHHSLRVAGLARRIAAEQGLSAKTAEDAFLAGLLHDVGKLVVADNFPKVYGDMDADAPAGAVHAREMDALGASHAEIGAYLMGLWGFPDPIVAAAAFHHQPSRCPSPRPAVLEAVHAAHAPADPPETTFGPETTRLRRRRSQPHEGR